MVLHKQVPFHITRNVSHAVSAVPLAHLRAGSAEKRRVRHGNAAGCARLWLWRRREMNCIQTRFELEHYAFGNRTVDLQFFRIANAAVALCK